MFKRFIPTVVAMLVGLLVLLGYLLPVEFLVLLRDFLLRWATVLAVFAMILAFFSLLRIHFLRLTRGRKNRIASLLVVVSALAALALVMLDMLQPDRAGIWTQPLLNWILVPGESALLALTAVTLIVAGMRIMRTRRTIGGVIFVIAAAIVLLTTVAYSFYPDILAALRQGVDTLATAGMRGLMLGVALGVTLTGLRVILGFDRPHSDE
ncbi:MAG TPA: hypothetical protein PKZ84_16510 [Anaerolineae bacterium]|nr:hypothetical protein [Anaerolineae bacterium]HQI86238.1 hypothetical protein [Anaerolineae bacterium]